MKITNIETPSIIRNEQLPQIVERIFAIARHDPSFHLKDKIASTDTRIKKISQRVSKHEELLKQANDVLKKLSRKVVVLSNENQNKIERLLEEIEN